MTAKIIKFSKGKLCVEIIIAFLHIPKPCPVSHLRQPAECPMQQSVLPQAFKATLGLLDHSVLLAE